MSLRKFFLHDIMRRGESTNEDDTETESVDEDVTDSEESGNEKRVHFLGLPVRKFTYKRLPKKCLKFSFLILNGSAFLAGITATVSSIWMLADSKLMSRLFSQRLFVTILLFIGLFACSVSFLGIMAFVKKRRKFITSYILCHVLSLAVIFICAVLSFSFFDKIIKKIHDDMTNTIVNYRSLDWVTEAWDNTHKYLHCCGIRSFRDWEKYRMQIPHSCCSTTIDKCLNMSEEVAYQSGCLKESIILLKSHVHSVSVGALLISIGLAVSLFLAFGIRRRFKIYQRD